MKKSYIRFVWVNSRELTRLSWLAFIFFIWKTLPKITTINHNHHIIQADPATCVFISSFLFLLYFGQNNYSPLVESHCYRPSSSLFPVSITATTPYENTTTVVWRVWGLIFYDYLLFIIPNETFDLSFFKWNLWSGFLQMKYLIWVSWN